MEGVENTWWQQIKSTFFNCCWSKQWWLNTPSNLAHVYYFFLYFLVLTCFLIREWEVKFINSIFTITNNTLTNTFIYYYNIELNRICISIKIDKHRWTLKSILFIVYGLVIFFNNITPYIGHYKACAPSIRGYQVNIFLSLQANIFLGETI